MFQPAHPAVTLTPLPGGGFVSESAPCSLVSESFPSTDFGSFIGPGYGLFGGDQGNDLLSGRYGGWWPADRVQLPNHAPAGFFSEQQHRIAISWSRYLCERNMLAVGLLSHVQTFVGPVTVQWVRNHQTPGAMSAGVGDVNGDGRQDADDLVKVVQQVWEEWCQANDWGMGIEDREEESRVRFRRDGECNVRLGAGRADREYLPWVRFIEPEQIRYPSGRTPEIEGYDSRDINWQWGKATHKRDAETVLACWLCDPENSGDGEVVMASELVLGKSNVDRTIKRGLPDFFPIEQHLQDSLGIIANACATAREQSSVAWIETYANATADQVRDLLSKGPEAYSRAGAGAVNAKIVQQGGGSNRFPIKQHGTTRVIHADNNKQFDPGPTTAGVPSFMQMVEGTLKAVGLRWGIQDVFGAGGSFASELVEGSDFVRHTENRQKQQIGFTVALALKVIRFAEESGRLPAGTSKLVKPVATAKPVVIGDEEKKVRTDLALLEKGVADPMEIIKKRGGDPKIVFANLRVWKQETGQGAAPPAPPGTPGTPPAGGGAKPPTGPNATPPGSAGGDGSSPNADPLDGLLTEDGVWVSEAGYTLLTEAGREGLVKKEITNSKGRKQTVWVRQQQEPTPSAKEVKAQAQAEAHAHVKAALADPSKLTPADVKTLAGKLATLTAEQLKPLRQKLKTRAGRKQEVIDGLTEWARSQMPPPPDGTPKNPVVSRPLARAGEFVAAKLGKPSADPKANAPSPDLPNGTRPALSSSEVQAIKTYTGAAYESINNDLRGKGSEWSDPAHKATHEELQKAFERAPVLPEPVTVYRGVNLSGMPNNKKQQFLSAVKTLGKTVTLGGYTSTTTDASDAYASGSEVKVTIKATHGLDVKPYSAKPQEKELLLNHGSKFKVVGYKQVGKQHQVELEQVA